MSNSFVIRFASSRELARSVIDVAAGGERFVGEVTGRQLLMVANYCLHFNYAESASVHALVFLVTFLVANFRKYLTVQDDFSMGFRSRKIRIFMPIILIPAYVMLVFTVTEIFPHSYYLSRS